MSAVLVLSCFASPHRSRGWPVKRRTFPMRYENGSPAATAGIGIHAIHHPSSGNVLGGRS